MQSSGALSAFVTAFAILAFLAWVVSGLRKTRYWWILKWPTILMVVAITGVMAWNVAVGLFAR